jgi:TPR repeat protein
MKKTLFVILIASLLGMTLIAKQSTRSADDNAVLQEAKSQYDLGMVYYKGKDLPQDYSEAYRLFRQAAENGLPEAITALGIMTRNGEGEEKNIKEAETLFIKAAEMGNPDAQFNLGIMHYAGETGKVSFEEGAKWFKRAAEQGNVEAMENLGFCYYEGSGVKADVSESYFWLKLAATLAPEEKKIEYTKAMEIKKAELSAAEVAKIDARVDTWLAAKQK